MSEMPKMNIYKSDVVVIYSSFFSVSTFIHGYLKENNLLFKITPKIFK